MIISHELRYVCIGIPRTGSKSMQGWLQEHFRGEWHGVHEWRVPDDCKDYLIFTMVRNPYDRWASSNFAVLWNDVKPDVSKRVPSPPLVPSPNPLHVRIRQNKINGVEPGNGMNQAQFIKRAGVHLALYFERLPQCLGDLPFVDKGNIPEFPYALERGIRPPGTFFDHFSARFVI